MRTLLAIDRTATKTNKVNVAHVAVEDSGVIAAVVRREVLELANGGEHLRSNDQSGVCTRTSTAHSCIGLGV